MQTSILYIYKLYVLCMVKRTFAHIAEKKTIQWKNVKKILSNIFILFLSRSKYYYFRHFLGHFSNKNVIFLLDVSNQNGLIEPKIQSVLIKVLTTCKFCKNFSSIGARSHLDSLVLAKFLRYTLHTKIGPNPPKMCKTKFWHIFVFLVRLYFSLYVCGKAKKKKNSTIFLSVNLILTRTSIFISENNNLNYICVYIGESCCCVI